jgi:hypothetical protein
MKYLCLKYLCVKYICKKYLCMKYLCMKYLCMKYLCMYEVILVNLTFLPCISVSFCCFSFCCSSKRFHISLAIYIIVLLLDTSTQYIIDILKLFILFSVFVSVSVMFVPIYISNVYHYSFFYFLLLLTLLQSVFEISFFLSSKYIQFFLLLFCLSQCT